MYQPKLKRKLGLRAKRSVNAVAVVMQKLSDVQAKKDRAPLLYEPRLLLVFVHH